MECALLRRDLRAVNDPLRAPACSLLAGCLLATIVLAGCAIAGLLAPQIALGDAAIVMGQESGALYVRVGETWHPVLNLASARLIAAANVNPRPIRESQLDRAKRGPILGIPGAPQYLGRVLSPEESVWTLCDTASGATPTTTVIVGNAEETPGNRLASAQTVLVTTDANAPLYLLYNGQRAMVDAADPVLARALRLEGAVPRTVSRLLLNAVPEAPPITVPRIPGAGAPGAVPGFAVGSVLRVSRAGGDEYYVVLSAGVQRVGQVTADLVRLTSSQGARSIIAVAPDAIRASRTVNALQVSTFPDRVSAPPDSADTTLCVRWAPRRDGGADVSLLADAGLPLPTGQSAVTLAQADNGGPALDAVYLPAGRIAYVRSTGLSGDNVRVGPRYLVADTGVRFGIHDDDAQRDLGLPATAVAAPWPVLAALPQGPELSRQNASVARDTVGGGFGPGPQPPQPSGRGAGG